MIKKGRFVLFEQSVFSILFLLTAGCPFLDYELSLLSSSSPIEETIIESIGSSQSFAFWSFSIPMWEVKKYPQVEEKLYVDNRNEQLLFLLKSLDDERVIMFMHLAFSDFMPLVSHRLYIEEEIDSNNVFDYFYFSSEYEGKWCLTMITIQQKSVIVETNAMSTHLIPDLSQELNNVKFIIGGTGIINTSHQLGIFRGRLSKLIQFTDYSGNSFQLIKENCAIPRNVVGKQIVNLIPGLKNFQGDTQLNFEVNEVGQKFYISGWIKLDPSEASFITTYLVLRLTTFKLYSDELRLGDEILKITVDLDLAEPANSGYNIISHHYNMPVQGPVNPNFVGRKRLDDPLSPNFQTRLTKWHFIVYQHGLSDLFKSQMKINFQQGQTYELNVIFFDDFNAQGLFINTKYYIIFGGDLTVFRKLRGQMQNFQFCYNYEVDEDIQFQCHPTCFNCVGPLASNCLGCKDGLNRRWSEDLQTCFCTYGYIEIDGTCYSFNDIYPTLQFDEMPMDQTTSICPFGYFYLEVNKECIRCPQTTSTDLLCVDCLFDPNTWPLFPVCKTDYVTQKISFSEDAYRKQQRSSVDNDVYFIDQNFNLQLIEGASDYCNTDDELPNCFEFEQMRHLSNKVYLICKENHYFSNNQCVQLEVNCKRTEYKEPKCLECMQGYYLLNDKCEQCSLRCTSCNSLNCLSCPSGYEAVGTSCLSCGNYCSTCISQMNLYTLQPYMKCLKCVDDQKYFQSLNGVDCVKNTITNCLYAFQVAAEHDRLTTLDHSFTPYTGLIITKCAKCKEPYSFDEQTLHCVMRSQISCSYNYRLSSSGNDICLFGPKTSVIDPVSFTTGCIGLNQNCYTCIKGQVNTKVSYLCLICNNGYYSEKMTGQCQPCPINLHCLSCYQQNMKSKDNWKTDIRPYYRQAIDDNLQSHSFIDYGTSQNIEDYEVVCKFCQSGYELYQNLCIKACPDSCIQCIKINNENICVKCPDFIDGRFLSLHDNECIQCPISCSLCRQRDQDEIMAINPLFNNANFKYSSNQCLKQFHGYFDQQLGIFVNCEHAECIRKLQINLNLYCSSSDYNDALNQLLTEVEVKIFKQSNILINDLFSPNSFQQFETDEFYKQANEKVIKTILIKIVSNKPQTCTINNTKNVRQIFSQNIFSAINVELEIHGNSITTFKFDKVISFINFKRVYLSKMTMIPFEINNQKQLIFVSSFTQQIQLSDLIYTGDASNQKQQIIIKNSNDVVIENLKLSNIDINNVEAFITIDQIPQIQNVKISNIECISSQAQNIILLFLNLKETDFVEVSNVKIASKFTQVSFLQSYFYFYSETKFNPNIINLYQRSIKQVSGNLIINNIQIEDSQISNTNGLFNFETLLQVEITQFLILNSIIINSTILYLNGYSSLKSVEFKSNELSIESIGITNKNVEVTLYTFQDVSFKLNKYDQSSSLVKVKESFSPNKVIRISKLSLIANTLTSIPSLQFLEQQLTTLFYLQIQNVSVTDLSIERAYGIRDITFADVIYLNLNRINIQQHEQHLFKGLHQYVDCFTRSIQSEYYITSLYLYDVSQIDIRQLTIDMAESINYPIINIQSSIAVSSTSKSLHLEEINFTNNLIIIINKMKSTSLFQMSSEQEYQITILNSFMKYNLMHQYEQNDRIYSGLIFNFDCPYCTIKITNLLVEDNLVTNTTDNVISLKAKSISIRQSKFFQNSIFQYSIIQPYLLWGFHKNEEIFVEQIKQIFPIRVITGNIKLIGQNINLENLNITNSSGSGLYIKIESVATLLIKNTIFNHITTHFIDSDENGGAIYIDSSYAMRSNILLSNITASNIHCRNYGGLLFLLNGESYIQINLTNLNIADVYALRGSIVYSEFSSTFNSIQSFKISHLVSANNLQKQLLYFQKFIVNKLDSAAMQTLSFQRSLIKISNAQTITMEYLQISELNFESLGFFDNIKGAQIKQIQLTQCQLINSFIVINTNQDKSQIFIHQLKLHNSTILDIISLTPTSECTNSESQTKLVQFQCLTEFFQKQSPVKLNSNNEVQSPSCLIQKLKQLDRKSNASLIYLNLYNSSLSISQVSFQYLKCPNGLLFINFQRKEGTLSMKNVNVQNNICELSSCLKIVKTSSSSRILENLNQYINKKQYDFKLQDYICSFNYGYEGTCLQISNIKTLIVSSIFQHNVAHQSGGSMIVIGEESFILAYCTIQNNTAQFGGGFAVADQISQNLTRLGSVLNENNALKFGANQAQLPSSLSITTDTKNVLAKVKIIEQSNLLIEQIEIKPYQVFTNTYSDALYVPNGQKLSKYEYFDWKKGEYYQYNLHLRIVALDPQNEVQENLNNTYCEISGGLLRPDEITEFSNNFTNMKNISFNSTDYNLDDIIFYLDDELNMTLQMQFYCNSIYVPIYGEQQEIISYHNNYYLRLNIKTLPCQMGEIKRTSDLTCQPCDSEQGQYSVSFNSQNCTIKDDSSTKEIKSAQMNLRPGYWRPYFYNDQISSCINLLSNCLGGWKEGDTSCFIGHIGALCEECDIYNLRGEGHFSTSTKYSCSSCAEKDTNSIIITAISIWTLVSILISVKGTVSLLEDIALKVQVKKIRFFMSMQESYSGILIKMLTNHLQILSTITSFKLNLPSGMASAINASGNPIQTMTYSLDCFLMEMFYFNIHYSRMIWQMIMPFIYIFIFFLLYWIAIKLKKVAYSVSVITTTFIYLYIYLQPNLVGGLISLISFRNISNVKWIQANVAYRYDTFSHFLWLLSFCLPGLLVIAFLIPFFFYYALYINKDNLNDKRVRQQWGYLYNEYKTDVYFWEIVKIVEKELLIIFLSYYDETIVKKGILVLLVVYIYLELNTKFKPYQSPNLNRLDAYSANVCEISIALGIGIYVDQIYGSLEIQIPYFIILATLNLYFLLLVLKEILQSYKRDLEIQLDKVRDLVRQKAPWTMEYRFLNKELQNRQEMRIRVKSRYRKIREYLMEQAKQILEFKQYIQGTKTFKTAKIYPEQFSECSQPEEIHKEPKQFIQAKESQSNLDECFV